MFYTSVTMENAPMRFAPPCWQADPVCLWPAEAQLGEGTCWSVRKQVLYWVDILGQCLHRWRPADGEHRTWQLPEQVTTVAERKDGSLLLALRQRLVSFDPETQTLQTLQTLGGEPTGNRFNDGKCDTMGRFWVGTMDTAGVSPSGALYRYEGDKLVLAYAANCVATNGPTWSLDGRTLYLCDSTAGRIHALDVDPSTGQLSRPRTWQQWLPNEGYPDGMTTDAQGRLWVCHWGAGCVTCHAPDSGAELARVLLPVSQVTNVAFGGADLRTLFITSARVGLSAQALAREPLAGGLFALRCDEPGLPAPLFKTDVARHAPL